MSLAIRGNRQSGTFSASSNFVGGLAPHRFDVADPLETIFVRHGGENALKPGKAVHQCAVQVEDDELVRHSVKASPDRRSPNGSATCDYPVSPRYQSPAPAIRPCRRA